MESLINNIDISTVSIPLPNETPSTSTLLKPSTTAPVPGTSTQMVQSKQQKQSQIFKELFTNEKYVKYYTMKSTKNSDLTKLNMFKVDKAIKAAIGVCEKISEDYSEKGWTIVVKSAEQGNKLKNMTKLLEEPITITHHQEYNQCQGVITCSLLKGYSDEDITEGLSEQGVIKCYRIIKNAKSLNPQPTTTLILTFNTPNLPDKICIRTGMYERVRLYIPLPRRCKKCIG